MMSPPGLVIAIGLGLALMSPAAPGQTTGARGLEFRSYLLLRHGMPEGQVLGIAGQPDLLVDQGVVLSHEGPVPPSLGGRTELAVKTYTYLPTVADPYATTVRLVGGRVTEIRRDGWVDPSQTPGARGLDFSSYLFLRPGMSEGQLLSLAGKPDLLSGEGVVIAGTGQPHGGRGSGHAALAVRTYTYLPTTADPETTTVTFVGGRVTDIRRDRNF